MDELIKRLRADAELIHNNGITRKPPRHRVAALLREAADAVEAAREDACRLDWLADRDNPIGNVQLPNVCVMNNMHSLRAAIDDAMRIAPELYAAIDQARGNEDNNES